MSKKINPALDPEVQIEQAIGRSEHFIERNGKNLLIALCAIVLIIAGYFGYIHLVETPKNQKAEASVFMAQRSFEANEFEKALNGDANGAGFLEIVKQFGSTPTGNMASHYAGICYLRTGDFKNAIASLEKYKDVDGAAAELINAQNKGLIGDAYIELKDNDKAITFYEKAIAVSENQLTAPYYLMKLAGVYVAKGDTAKALECYETVKTKFYNSNEARDIDKYIGKLTK